jgi:hypothetical protein
MSDIVLAECSGQAWLVRGEQHIDDLLGNTLTADINIEIILCESKSAVDSLWRRWNDDDPSAMWLIHPAIVNRARGQAGEIAVVFAEWSASLDDAAHRAMQAAAAAAGAKPTAALVLVRHVAELAPPMALQMADLRCALLEARLAELGVARMERETRVAERAHDAERIRLDVRE